jgi:competence protein ComGC
MINDELEIIKLNNTDNNLTSNSNLYKQQNYHLKRNIILVFFISILIFIFVLGLLEYNRRVHINNSLDIVSIENQISDLEKKSADIEAMVRDAKRFKVLWDKTNEKKKNFTEKKISSISEDFTSLAKEYNISKSSINISVPQILSTGVWKTQNLDVVLINFNISFDAMTDKLAIDFIRKFINGLSGYIIVDNFEIKKNLQGEYSNDMLVKISNGEFYGLVSSKINFYWYYPKQKVVDKKEK